MALTYGFYNSLNGDRRYNAMQLSELIDGLITDGIFPEVGDKFQVQATSGLEISIGSGKAWFNKTWTLNDSAFLISLPAAEPLTSRIDAVVLDIDTSEVVRANSIKIISGEPGISSPDRPSLVKGSNKNQYALCYISRSPNNNQITNADITNVIGTNETPMVKSVMTGDNVEKMPISGGVLENYREKSTTVSASGGSIDLSLGNVFQHTPSADITYSITNAVNGQAHSFTLIINMLGTVRTLTFPASVKWQGGEIPDMSTANKTYVLTFMTVDGGTTWLGMFGGEF